MTTATTFALTYGITLAASIVALALDAFGRRTSALVTVSAGLLAGAAAGIGASLMRTPSSAVGPVGVGGLASMVYGVIALVGAAAVLGGVDSLKEHANGGSIAALIAFTVAAAGGTAAALDLTTLLLLLETMALAGYALIAVARTARSGEAAMKYFVQGAVATGLFLFGMAILVGLFEPTGDYMALRDVFAAPRLLFPALAGAALILSALTFKMGAVPFHSWAPDAYETAPVEAAAFLAAGPKLAAIAATSVFVTIVAGGVDSQRILVVVAAIAVLSVLVGSVAALRQRNYRRLLAYAGIAQSGYALIAIALPMAPLAIFFGSTYALATVGTFLAAAAYTRLKPDWDGSLAGLAGLGRRAPVLSGALAVLLISLAGLPPFLGFWAKLLVFYTGLTFAVGGLETAPQLSWPIIVAVASGILGSIVSLGYYGSVLRTLYFDSEENAENGTEGAPGSSYGGSAGVVVVVLALIVVVLSLLPLLLGPSVLSDAFSAR